MNKTNDRKRCDAGANAPEPTPAERHESEPADTGTETQWEDGTAMPYWVAPDNARDED
jgi:hypothetical protein